MSIKALNWAFDLHFKIPSHKLVMLALADNATNEGLSYPFLKTIGKKACIKDERSLRRILRKLEADGYITTEPHFKKNNKQTSNCYQLNMDREFKTIENLSTGGVCRPGKGGSTDQGWEGLQTPHSEHKTPKTINKSNELQNHENHQPKLLTKSINLKQEACMELPFWLDKDLWNEFKEHRKHIKKPLSLLAEKKAIRILEKLKENGSDPKDIIDNSIVNGWSGLFPLKQYKENKSTNNEPRCTVPWFSSNH